MSDDDGVMKAPRDTGIPGPRSFSPPDPRFRKRSKWADIVAQVRKDAVVRMDRGTESQWAVVATYTKGGRDKTRTDRRRDIHSLGSYLRRNYRLEAWDISQRTIPDTWYHRQLLLRFGGFLTEAEAEVYWRKRREASEVKANHKRELARRRDARRAIERDQEAIALREKAIRDRTGRVG